MMDKGTVVFDFDGVIHSYVSGWQGPEVASDPPVQGIAEAIQGLRDRGYEIVVVSTRCASPCGLECVYGYMRKYKIPYDKIMAEKPPAIAYIDDRAICFDGDASSLVQKVVNFVPWNKQ